MSIDLLAYALPAAVTGACLFIVRCLYRSWCKREDAMTDAEREQLQEDRFW